MAVLLTLIRQCGVQIHPIAFVSLNLLDDVCLVVLATIGVAITIPLWYKILAAVFVGFEAHNLLCKTIQTIRDKRRTKDN